MKPVLTDIIDRHEVQVLAEQELAESRALLEGTPPAPAQPLGFFAVLQRFRDASKCTTCGRSTAVLNAARRGFKAERITPASHCTCPGGPVDLQARGHLTPLHVAGSGEETR